MGAALPCGLGTMNRPFKLREIDSERNPKKKNKHACVAEAARKRVERTLPKDHDDHIAEKGFNSLSHHTLVHNVDASHAIKILDAKAALDKEWEKLEKLPAWQLTNVKSKNKVILEAQEEQRKVHFSALMDICHIKSAELEPENQKYKGRVVLRGDMVKDDSELQNKGRLHLRRPKK